MTAGVHVLNAGQNVNFYVNPDAPRAALASSPAASAPAAK